MSATRLQTARLVTRAINCALCARRPHCDEAPFLELSAHMDAVLQCPTYYPEALHRAGYPVDTPAAREHRAWIESVITRREEEPAR